MNNLYDNLSKMNILRQCKPLFEPPYGRGVLYLDPETNLITAGRKRIQMDSSWIMNKTPVGTHCAWNMTILFGCFGKILQSPPTRCHSCWKVSVNPMTIRQLFALGDYWNTIKDNLYGCKYGIDIRDYSRARYGGYIYCTGPKENALQTIEKYKPEIQKLLGDDIEVSLKRGCTEYELEYGDSNSWVLTDEQRLQEAQIAQYFDKEIVMKDDFTQPDLIKVDVAQRLIEYAVKIGDPTYTDFVNKPLHVVCLNHERTENKIEGF